MSKIRANARMFDWYEQYVTSPKQWGDLEDVYKCPFPHYKIIPHHERTFVSDFQEDFEFVAWLFQNHDPDDFALVIQDDDRNGTIKPEIYGFRGMGPVSGYITGVLFNDDILMMEFKLRFGDIIQA
jgi:hypothetical protein